ncbi:MAG: primosomal protein N' [Nitrospinae bacterium]|nr:primosomal protein N' [Nitrospinota bacterium]
MISENKELCFADVIVPRPVRGLFTYSIPHELRDSVAPGKRVLVPFGKRSLVGLVASLKAKAQMETRPIVGVLDAEPFVDAGLLDLALWTSLHYYAPPGDFLPVILPRGDYSLDTVVVLKPGSPRPSERSAKAVAVYDALSEKGGSRRLELLAKDIQSTPGALKKILSGSAVRAFIEIRQGTRAVASRKSGDAGLAVETSAVFLPPLTTAQNAVYESVARDMDTARFRVSLLHGVTGSGKTEVYAYLAKKALDMGKSALILAPEIALADMLAERFMKRFENPPVVLHSDMAPKERDTRLYAVRSAPSIIVVGARSAVFAPVNNLGLVIVDEEHDPSYKQETSPRYNGRDVAIKRASMAGAPVLLGSATPSLESYHHSVSGKYHLLALASRVDGRPMPRVEIVEPERAGEIGERLKAEIEDRLKKGEQTLLFINRRGAARYIQCSTCGHAYQCRNCSVSLVLHGVTGTLDCHLCGYKEKAPDTCAKCGSASLRMGGAGSERVETEIRRLFPTARVARMDRDTTAGRRAGAKILSAVGKGEVDILIGTQMITKGHDYPAITLVGAVSADDSLNMPDFRSSERTFQLITQAAGRAGRGDVPGLVIVQATSSASHCLVCAANHDFESFLSIEYSLRQMVGYPPFTRMAMIRVDASSERKGLEFFEKMSPSLKTMGEKVKGLALLGPAEALVFKARNRYHWRLSLKGEAHSALFRALDIFFKGMENLGKGSVSGVNVSVDVDPASSM